MGSYHAGWSAQSGVDRHFHGIVALNRSLRPLVLGPFPYFHHVVQVSVDKGTNKCLTSWNGVD